MKKHNQPAFLRRGHLCLAAVSALLALAFSASQALAGTGDTKTGDDALVSQTASCTDNTADGYESLYSLTAGTGDTAIGASTLIYTSASDDTALGYAALYSDQSGGSNTAVGAYALDYLSTGGNNIAIGEGAGSKVTIGSDDIYIGNTGSFNNEGNTIRIGNPTVNNGGTYISGIDSATVQQSTSAAVFIDQYGHLGTISSSLRFKKDIQPMGKSSEVLLSLKPVTFHYKSDSDLTPCYGLIAEEVAKVDPHLVIRDAKGQIMTVRYEQVNAMLLNEFLKEHQKVEKQAAAAAEQDKKLASLEATVTTQEARLAAQEKLNEQLTASLKEQAALIQKVSMQMDANKPAMRTASNDQ